MNTKLKHVENWLELAKEADWSAAKMAEMCNVSVRTLERYFLQQMQKPPKAWLIDQRQKRAMKLLNTGFSVKQVTSELNYQHASTFSREFKKFWKVCPTNHSLTLAIKT